MEVSAPSPASVAARTRLRTQLVCAAATVALAAVAYTRASFAQSRGLDWPGAAPVALAPRCTARVRALAPLSPTTAPDARVAPAAVATDAGLLAAWRTGDARVMLARLGPGHERLAEDREIAGPALAFALAPAPGGAAAALVERGHRGTIAVLLARMTSTGDARNVPRELGRAEGVDGVAVVWAGAGYAVAWGARGATPGAAGTYVVFTDARGVPHAPPRRVLDATAPHLAYLPLEGVVVLAATGADGAPTALALGADGTTRDSTRWPTSARGLAVSAAGGSVLAAGTHDDPAGGLLTVTRWSVHGAVFEAPAAWRVGGNTRVAAVAADRAGGLIALDEPGGRELLVRVASDGTVALLATRVGTLGAIVPGDDATTVTLVGHDAPGASLARLSVTQLNCPRPAVVPGTGMTPSTTIVSPADAATVRAATSDSRDASTVAP